MQLDGYRQRENGMYILSRQEIDQISESILAEVCPENLVHPIPLNIDKIIYETGLDIKFKYIGSLDSGILGLIVLGDEAEILTLDECFTPVTTYENFGTILINPQTMTHDRCYRDRYTKVHEISHYYMHKEFFRRLCGYGAINPSACIACRSMEIGPQNNAKTEYDWMEWQADNLAASLLMPKYIFLEYAKHVIRNAGNRKGYLVTDNSTDRNMAQDIIQQIATRFKVSRRAAQIRMLHLGLIHYGNTVYTVY